jgi:predicted TIM-barrel fold metal-dependent hydrolase
MLISSDSHVVEPGDLWTSRLPADLRDRAPRATQDPDNHHWYLTAPEMPRGVDLTLSRNAGISVAEVDEILRRDPDADVGAHGGHDPVARLADMWADDTVADVVYPTAGLSVFQIDDVALQEACCAVYNDWLSEFCAVDHDRLVGLALIPTFDIGRAVAELRRARAAGLKGAIIWTAPPLGDTFFDPRYEPLWSAAAELSMPISLHILAGRRGSRQLADFNKDVQGSFYFGFETRNELQRSVCELIAAGVFERHPDLRVVAAEGGIDYAATLEDRLDRSFQSFWGKLTDMKMLPSEYFRRNVYLTYITDHIGLNNIRYTGSDHFMWSSDYPHGAALWPHSADYVASSATEAGLDPETVANLTLFNAARLYGIDLDKVRTPSPLVAEHVR